MAWEKETRGRTRQSPDGWRPRAPQTDLRSSDLTERRAEQSGAESRELKNRDEKQLNPFEHPGWHVYDTYDILWYLMISCDSVWYCMSVRVEIWILGPLSRAATWKMGGNWEPYQIHIGSGQRTTWLLIRRRPRKSLCNPEKKIWISLCLKLADVRERIEVPSGKLTV